MKKTLIMLSLALLVAGCNRTPRVDTLREEVLDKSMVTPEIEVTHTAGCMKFIPGKCQIKRIESVATMVSNGGTNNNRQNAYDAACLKAMAQVNEWKGQRVESMRSIESIAESKELSKSQEKQDSADINLANENSGRENSNDTKWTVTNVIRTNASHFMTGWKRVRDGDAVINKQEVRCTVRWDQVDSTLLNTFNSVN